MQPKAGVFRAWRPGGTDRFFAASQYRRSLLVTDPGIEKAGLVPKMMEIFDKAGTLYSVYGNGGNRQWMHTSIPAAKEIEEIFMQAM